MYCSYGIHGTGNDKKADELYLKATKELDPKKAAQYFNDFQVYVRSLYINVGIAQTDNLFVYNPKTVGKWTGRTWVSYWDAVNGIQHPK
jgi:ABC-type transport system substrate-binding protein